MNESSAFAANYDTNVQALLPYRQINIAEPRKTWDEVSLLSTELFFEALKIRLMVLFHRLKRAFFYF
jgi:hypothetical protein